MPSDLPNIVLVVLDTARLDRFGCYGYARPTTPTVDSLARGGLRVETMVSNAPWTQPAHASLFTGLYPSQHGAQWRTGPKLRPAVEVTMAEWLRGLGYDTWCVTNNGMISSRTGLARGFDHYVFRMDLEAGWRRRWRRLEKVARGGDSGGRIVNRWMRDELPRAKRPTFLFVNYLECHWAYAPPPRFVSRVGGPAYGPLEAMRYRARVAARVGPWEAIARGSERDLDVLSTYYDAELANVDEHLDELLGVLETAGIVGDDGRSLVMVTSDHGEHLGEHGLADHHASLDEILCRVPFVAWGPGVIPAGIVREPLAEFVDVLPSVARLLDQKPPAAYLEKRRTDLFTDGGTDGHAYAFAEWRAWADGERARLARRNPSYRGFDALARDLLSARDRRFKLVRGSDGREELFDLDADPGEGTDVGASHPEMLSTLRSQLDALTAEWASWASGPSAEISSEERAEIESRLEDLGYI
jgi:arylsulfatase A-like enzyme